MTGEAHERGVYDDGRSRDKGVEPEGVALLDIAGRTYAFVGLERTTSAAIAVFDVTSPYEVEFVDMIVTPGNLPPEGLAAFEVRGDAYLAIANEVPASGADDDPHDSLPGRSRETVTSVPVGSSRVVRGRGPLGRGSAGRGPGAGTVGRGAGGRWPKAASPRAATCFGESTSGGGVIVAAEGHGAVGVVTEGLPLRLGLHHESGAGGFRGGRCTRA